MGLDDAAISHELHPHAQEDRRFSPQCTELCILGLDGAAFDPVQSCEVVLPGFLLGVHPPPCHGPEEVLTPAAWSQAERLIQGLEGGRIPSRAVVGGSQGAPVVCRDPLIGCLGFLLLFLGKLLALPGLFFRLDSAVERPCYANMGPDGHSDKCGEDGGCDTDAQAVFADTLAEKVSCRGLAGHKRLSGEIVVDVGGLFAGRGVAVGRVTPQGLQEHGLQLAVD